MALRHSLLNNFLIAKCQDSELANFVEPPKTTLLVIFYIVALINRVERVYRFDHNASILFLKVDKTWTDYRLKLLTV